MRELITPLTGNVNASKPSADRIRPPDASSAITQPLLTCRHPYRLYGGGALGETMTGLRKVKPGARRPPDRGSRTARGPR